MLSVGQRLQDGAGVSVDTRIVDAVAAPVDSNAVYVQDHENDRSGDSEGGAEGSGGDAESLSAQNSQSGVGEVTH